MLRTNLSTRPFYNERAVRAALAALGALALGLTVFNAYEIIRLRAANSDARATISSNDAQASTLREQRPKCAARSIAPGSPLCN